MSTDWTIAKAARCCAATGRRLEVGEICYAALREEGEAFVRLDYSADAWPAVDKGSLFSFWKGKVPPEETDRRRRLVIDPEAFYAFFRGLDGAESESRRLFRYLAALVLVRKRLLRLDRIDKGPEGDELVLFDRRTEESLRVAAPPVPAGRLEEAQATLNRIFECSIRPEDL